jgi:hypothetical protein
MESVRKHADRVIVVEVRFQGVKGPLHSTDDTIDIAKEYTDEVYLADGLPQHKQRDLYLKGGVGDFYFIIDGDEVLRGCFPKEEILMGPWDVYAVEVHRRGYRTQLCLRVFRHKKGIRHNIGQCPLIDDRGRLMDGSNYQVQRPRWFWLEHLK